MNLWRSTVYAHRYWPSHQSKLSVHYNVLHLPPSMGENGTYGFDHPHSSIAIEEWAIRPIEELQYILLLLTNNISKVHVNLHIQKRNCASICML